MFGSPHAIAGSDYDAGLDTYGLATAFFRCTGFIFAAALQIMGRQGLCGLRLRPALTPKSLLLDYQTDDLRSPLIRGIRPSQLTAETVDDIVALLATRLSDGLGPNVALADVELQQVASVFVRDQTFDIHTYRRLKQPLMPEVALTILHAMHPTAQPSIRLIKYPNPSSPTAPDLHVEFWPSTFLRVPLSTNENRGGVCAMRVPETGNVPAWLCLFGKLLCQHAPQIATQWQSRYSGINTPQYSVMQVTPRDMQMAISKTYEGWIWILAYTHWLFAAAAEANTIDRFEATRTWLRHHFTAIRVLNGLVSPVSITTFDVDNIEVLPSRLWARGLNSVASIDVSTAPALLNNLIHLKIIKMSEPLNEYELERDEPPHAFSPTPLTSLVVDLETENLAWRHLLGVLDASIQIYVEQRKFI